MLNIIQLLTEENFLKTATHNFPERPGNGCQDDDQGYQEIPECPFVFQRVGNLFFYHTPPQSYQCRRNQHTYRMFNPEEAVEFILHQVNPFR